MREALPERWRVEPTAVWRYIRAPHSGALAPPLLFACPPPFQAQRARLAAGQRGVKVAAQRGLEYQRRSDDRFSGSALLRAGARGGGWRLCRQAQAQG